MSNTIGVITAPFTVEFVKRPLPDLAPDEALVRVRASAICGSDLHIFRDKHPSVQLPCTIGHEFSGDVVKLGGVRNEIAVGDRVTLEPVIACGYCDPCLQGMYGYCENISFSYREGDGSMSSYVKCKSRFLHKIPENITYEAGALIEPLAVATHAVRRSQVKLGDKVAIFGAGAIGILVAAVCAASGAETIVVSDFSSSRLAMAKNFGATHTVNAAQEDALELIANLSDGAGFDKSIECVGAEVTFNQAMFALKRGGQMTQLGIFERPEITINAARFVSHEISVIGAQGYCWDFPIALQLAQKLPLDELVTHSFPLQELEQALRIASDPASESIKVLVLPVTEEQE